MQPTPRFTMPLWTTSDRASLARWDVACALCLFALYVPYAASYGTDRNLAEAVATFGGLAITSVAATLSRPARPRGRFVQVAWPILWWPMLYPACVEVIQLERGRYFDSWFYRFDAALFGWGPHGPGSAWLGGPLEELANLFYVSYYLLVPLGMLLLWRRSADLASRYSTAVLLAFTICGVLWLLVPAGGLHPTGSPLTPAWGPFTAIAREVYATNPHFAAAFPSSHVALAFAAASSWSHAKERSWPWTLWASGVAMGTIVGQYHYTTDAAAGVVVGVTAAAVSFRGAARVDRAIESVGLAARPSQG